MGRIKRATTTWVPPKIDTKAQIIRWLKKIDQDVHKLGYALDYMSYHFKFKVDSELLKKLDRQLISVGSDCIYLVERIQKKPDVLDVE